MLSIAWIAFREIQPKALMEAYTTGFSKSPVATSYLLELMTVERLRPGS